MSIENAIQLVVGGIIVGGIYALLALGIHIVYVSAKIINFAHGAVVLIGGLVALTLLGFLRQSHFVILIPLFFVGWGIGIFFNRIVLNPIAKDEHGKRIVCLIAASLVIENLCALIWGKDSIPFPLLPGGEDPVVIWKIRISPQGLWVFGFTVIAVVFTNIFLYKTLLGKALRAVANNEIAARIFGIRPKQMISTGFGISMGLATLAGMLISTITMTGGYIAFPLTVKGFTAAMIGGIQRSTSCIVGGLLFGVIESITAGFITTQYREAVVMGILLVILLFRPQGLLGRVDREI